jgi:glycosyltransferase involved in cell wall biosynthesis
MSSIPDSRSILVAIPAYNAAETLAELIERIRRAVPNIPILVINDGSGDQTEAVATAAQVRVISFPQNRGKGAALRAAFRYALENRYEGVVTIDADLQHLPEEIPLFLERYDGKSILMGTRQIDTEVMPFGRWVSNNWTSMIVSIFSTRRVRDSQSGFRLIPITVLKSLVLHTDRYDLESELLFKAGALRTLVREVPVTTVYRESRSYIAPFRDTGRFIRQTWKRIWM